MAVAEKDAKGSIGNKCDSTPIKRPVKQRFRACSTPQVVAVIVEQALKWSGLRCLSQNTKALLAAAHARHTTVSEFLLARGIEAAEQVVAVPRVFYALEQGWAAIQQLLDDEDRRQPSVETIAWLIEKRRKA